MSWQPPGALQLPCVTGCSGPVSDGGYRQPSSGRDCRRRGPGTRPDSPGLCCCCVAAPPTRPGRTHRPGLKKRSSIVCFPAANLNGCVLRDALDQVVCVCAATAPAKSRMHEKNESNCTSACVCMMGRPLRRSIRHRLRVTNDVMPKPGASRLSEPPSSQGRRLCHLYSRQGQRQRNGPASDAHTAFRTFWKEVRKSLPLDIAAIVCHPKHSEDNDPCHDSDEYTLIGSVKKNPKQC